MQIEGLTQRVAEELQISQELAEEVIRSEFKFIVEKIKERKSINCIYLGKFTNNKRGLNELTGHTPNIMGT